MYKFIGDKKLIKNQIKACEEIGVTQPTLSNILNGKRACRKTLAFCITKYIDMLSEISDYFKEEEGE